MHITNEGIQEEGVQVAHPICGRASVETQVVFTLLEPVVLELVT